MTSEERQYEIEAKQAAKLARKSLLSVHRRASRMGMSRRQYIFYRAERNLEQFVNGIGFNLCVAILIILSVFLIFAEFLMEQSLIREKIVNLNDYLTWIFVVELGLRYVVAPNKRIYFKNFWIDIVAVLPVLRILRTFRLLRLLRLLRLSRASIILLRQSGWLSARIERYFGSFGVLLMSALFLVICGTLMLLTIEGVGEGAGGSLSLFIEKIWYTTFLFISGEVTGELPFSPEGRLVSVLITVSGMVVFAVMVGTISASMSDYFKAKADVKDLSLGDLNEHTIICGWDRMGDLILSELESVPDIWLKGVVVVAETDEDILEQTDVKNKRRLFHIRDDFTKMDVLEAVGAKRARSAVVLADKGENLKDQDRDARTVLAALTLEKLNPKIFTCAELLDEVNATHLKIAGVEEIISRTSLTAGLFASTLVNQGISSIIADVLTHKEGTYLKKISMPEQYVGKTYIEVFNQFKREFDCTVLAVDWLENERIERHINPPHERKMLADDVLVLMTNVDSKVMSVT